MTVLAETAAKWTCDRCGVSATQMSGQRSRLPAGWTSSGEVQSCLACRRELAGEAAVAAAPGHLTYADRTRLHRAAIIEFEVGRVPAHSNQQIARACGTSAGVVARSRQGLGILKPPARSTDPKKLIRRPA